jgi:hypothetical protein
MARQIKFAGRTISLPESKLLRLGIGTLLVLGGLLWFLPILGLWMIPLGLLVLSVDIAIIRRWRRRGEVKLGRWWSARNGYGKPADGASTTPSSDRGEPPAAGR